MSERCFNPSIYFLKFYHKAVLESTEEKPTLISALTHTKDEHHRPQQTGPQAWLQAMWPTLGTPSTQSTGTKDNKTKSNRRAFSLFSSLKAELHSNLQKRQTPEILDSH